MGTRCSRQTPPPPTPPPPLSTHHITAYTCKDSAGQRQTLTHSLSRAAHSSFALPLTYPSTGITHPLTCLPHPGRLLLDALGGLLQALRVGQSFNFFPNCLCLRNLHKSHSQYRIRSPKHQLLYVVRCSILQAIQTSLCISSSTWNFHTRALRPPNAVRP